MTALTSATLATTSLLEDYLEEQARRLHTQCGEVAGAAVTLAVNGHPVTVGSSTRLARQVDQAQYDIGTGPCLESLTTSTTLYEPDLAGNPRWSPYGRQAAALGARSCISCPVLVDGAARAVVKVYAADVDGLTPAQRGVAERTSVEIAGGVMLAERLMRQASELDDRAAAMTNRHVIDVAIGILMGSTDCTADAAFELLRQQSQRTNVKLRETAARFLLDRAQQEAPFNIRTGAD